MGLEIAMTNLSKIMAQNLIVHYGYEKKLGIGSADTPWLSRFRMYSIVLISFIPTRPRRSDMPGPNPGTFERRKR